ncbi:hypothetical protein MAR_000987 [Mya arenaria]|uniref:Uncharacterized protein n=1 Tax=Mya arenaria TaxID=6604 RepID=A0ABY7FDA1_MYAAR|nr:hypothetical protein MAR_000987 [Mya arenaria]
MATTDIRLSSVIYSNDGPSDKVRVQIDDMNLAVIETVTLMEGGRGWSLFRSPLGPFADYKITQGKHLLKVILLQSDPYGVEIDAVNINMDTIQPKSLRSCDVFCFNDVRFFDDVRLSTNSSLATAFQKSYKTTCAEVDNVNVPVIHESAKKFVVTASSPRYTTFVNNRDADWSGCKTNGPYFQFFGVDLSKGRTFKDRTTSLSISIHQGLGFKRDDFGIIGDYDINFSLPGQAAGSMDSEIGSLTVFKNLRFNGTMTVTFEYFNRYDQWIGGQSKSFTNYLDALVFQTPKFSFREGTGNLIKIKFYTNETNTDTFQIEELSMKRSRQKEDTSTTIYTDANTIIETVDVDLCK